MTVRGIAKVMVNSTLRHLGLQVRALLNDDQRRAQQSKKLTPEIVRKYFDRCSPRILQLAAGPDYRAECYRNWLNSDIANPVSNEGGVYSIYMDLNEGFPLPDDSFDYVFSQQGIEHFTYYRAVKILRECLRVLKPRGKIRIETPNLNYFIDRYRNNDRAVAPATHQFAKELDAPPTHLTSLNSIFFQFGHQYVYDIQALIDLCRQCGFADVREVEMCKTDIIPFQAAIAFNPCSNPDVFYIEHSFALEMEKSAAGSA